MLSAQLTACLRDHSDYRTVSPYWVLPRLCPSREFLEKFKIIFSRISREIIFEKFEKFKKPDLKYFLNFDFIFHVFRVLCLNFSEFTTTFDRISSLISIVANFVYILVVKKRRSGLSNAVDDLCFLNGYFD
jgi:hypothetical protein